MKQTPSKVLVLSPIHLFPIVESVVEYNISQLHAIKKPIALIKAVHTASELSWRITPNCTLSTHSKGCAWD